MTITQQCPICFGPLAVRDVAPCWDCGGFSEELEHFRKGVHDYTEWEIFPGIRAVLCDSCDVDFGSYDPTYFGLPKGTNIGFDTMRLIKKLNNLSITKDGYCPECQHRLAFLLFVAKARELHQSSA